MFIKKAAAAAIPLVIVSSVAHADFQNSNPNIIDDSFLGMSAISTGENALLSRNFTLPATNTPKLSARVFWPTGSTWDKIHTSGYGSYRKESTLEGYMYSLRPHDKGVLLSQDFTSTLKAAFKNPLGYIMGRSNGRTELIYTLWGTPKTYRKYTDSQVDPSCRTHWSGTGKNYAPRTQPYKNFVKNTYSKYFGKITAFEVWNEVNYNMFFCGTAQDLVNMTFAAREAIDEVYASKGGRTTMEDGQVRKVRKALVLAPSFTHRFKTHPSTPSGFIASSMTTNKSLLENYYRILRKTSDSRRVPLPIDAATVHGYAEAQNGLNTVTERAGTLKTFKDTVQPYLNTKNSPSGNPVRLWDTEFNMWTGKAPGSTLQTANDLSSSILDGLFYGYSHQQLYTIGPDTGPACLEKGHNILSCYADLRSGARNNQLALANLGSVLNNATIVDKFEQFLGDSSYRTLRLKRTFMFGETSTKHYLVYGNQYVHVKSTTSDPYFFIVYKKDGSKSPYLVTTQDVFYPNASRVPKNNGQTIIALNGTNTAFTSFEGFPMWFSLFGVVNR